LKNLEDRLREDYNYNYSERNIENKSDMSVKNESNNNYSEGNEEEESKIVMEDV
jgi:hypothetical protein